MNEQRSTKAVSYREDFYAWTQQQATLLRVLSRFGSDTPAGLDLRHLAEEIKDLGKAELRGATSLIRLIMIHMIKAASDPTSEAVGHWRTEAKTFHADLLGYFEPSMRQRISLQKIWRRAVDLAESALRERGVSLAAGIPERCPYDLQDFLGQEFDFDGALARIGGVKEPGAPSS